MKPPDDRVLTSPPDAEVVVGGRRFLYFGGTSYLGLHACREVIAASADALTAYGLHSATSRSGFGETPPLRDAERALARFFGTEAAFHFASGWPGVAIIVAACAGSFDAVLLDEHAHWSGFDGGAHGGRPVTTFPHRDADGFADALRRALPNGGRPLCITDGVFAATGHVAPLDAYVAVLAARGGGDLVVDDAHGFGVLGARGHGTCEHHGLADVNTDAPAEGVRVFACGTTSKALGAFGGAIAGDAAFLARARDRSHWFDGASAPPVPAAAAVSAALAVLMREPERRHHLTERTTRLRRGLRGLGIDVQDLPTPVVAVTGRSEAELRRIAAGLREDGILVPFMRYAGLPPEGALRIAVFATHTDAQIDTLLAALRRHL